MFCSTPKHSHACCLPISVTAATCCCCCCGPMPENTHPKRQKTRPSSQHLSRCCSYKHAAKGPLPPNPQDPLLVHSGGVHGNAYKRHPHRVTRSGHRIWSPAVRIQLHRTTCGELHDVCGVSDVISSDCGLPCHGIVQRARYEYNGCTCYTSGASGCCTGRLAPASWPLTSPLCTSPQVRPMPPSSPGAAAAAVGLWAHVQIITLAVEVPPPSPTHNKPNAH